MLPVSPGNGVSSMWPAPRLSVPSSLPSSTGVDRWSAGTVSVPSTVPGRGAGRRVARGAPPLSPGSSGSVIVTVGGGGSGGTLRMKRASTRIAAHHTPAAMPMAIRIRSIQIIMVDRYGAPTPAAK